MKVKLIYILFLGLILFSCSGGSSQKESKSQEKTESDSASPENQNDDWEKLLASIANVESYDGDRILEKGQGFFVGENLLATKYSLVNQATVVKVQPLDGNKIYSASKFVAFDRINDLIILEVDSISREPIVLVEGEIPRSAKTIYLAPKTGKQPNFSLVKF